MRARVREVLAVAACVAGVGGALAVVALRDDGGDGGVRGDGTRIDGGGGAAAAVALDPTPPRLARACRELAASHRVPVRCPARMPTGSARAGLDLANRDMTSGPDGYVIDAEAYVGGDRRTTPVPFHVIVAGTRTRYDLATTPGGRWPARFPPRADPLRLVPLGPLEPGEEAGFPRERVRVLGRGRDMVVLALPPHPLGGIHGGHVAALRTIGGASYAVSLHLAPGAMPRAEQGRLVAAVARTLREP